MKYYKVLNADGTSPYAEAQWHLPKRGPGKWMPEVKGELEICHNGYHLATRKTLIEWLDGPLIFEAEGRGEKLKGDNKVAFSQARLVKQLNWDGKSARLFACDCAERVLYIYEKHCPDDSRVRNAIDTARKVANGELPVSELAAARDAARAAAWAAARDAARDAARAAAWAAAWDAAWAAARAAARDAAWAAARAAAWAAARAAEREWQTKRLFEYLDGKR